MAFGTKSQLFLSFPLWSLFNVDNGKLGDSKYMRSNVAQIPHRDRRHRQPRDHRSHFGQIPLVPYAWDDLFSL